MKRYHIVRVKLNAGIEFLAKVTGGDIDVFNDWADSTPSIKEHEENISVSHIRPHATGKHKTKLAEARMAAGLTQREVADALGISIAQEQRWEYGIHKMRAETLKKYGEILGVDWSTLVEDE